MIIGLTGRKGSGKSLIAGWLIGSKGFVRTPFAEPLKNMLKEYLVDQGLSYADARRMLDGNLKEIPSELFCGKTPRQAMQTLGTEWGRNCIDLMFWTNAWKRKAKFLKNVVIDDVRFETEADAIRSLGGIIIRVDRDSADKTDLHPSEIEGYNIRPKFTIDNNKDPENAFEQIRLIYDIESYLQQSQVT